MSNDVTATQDPNVTLNVQQLEEVIRKIVREELMALSTQEQRIFHLEKESPLYKDMEDIVTMKETMENPEAEGIPWEEYVRTIPDTVSS